MGEHWEWAIQHVLQMPNITHVMYLRDRTVFVRNQLKRLLSFSSRFPDKVISYLENFIYDFTEHINFHELRWSGSLLELRSSDLIASTARVNWYFLSCLPRMLNCVVPKTVLETISHKFGNVFKAIAPDVSFAYRYLESYDSYLYYDRPLTVSYGHDRSNGASQTRGIITKDHADFLANLNGKRLNYAAPIPEFRTVMNAIIHEYCVIKQETKNSKFVDIDVKPYLDFIAYEIDKMDDPNLKQEMQSLLESYSPAFKTIRSALPNFRWNKPPLIIEFDSVSTALAYANTHVRARDWAVSYEESNIPVKFALKGQALAVCCMRTLQTILSDLKQLSRKVHRFANRYILWRFQR